MCMESVKNAGNIEAIWQLKSQPLIGYTRASTAEKKINIS